ncbi:PilZ domain-containing protein [Brevibacillus ginsengisoli]|uniref:PilZ domain-containing protein n=1 Tax=Brevibacillus ginsengisoli TaxID=363854 RepID=UPI003CF397DD
MENFIQIKRGNRMIEGLVKYEQGDIVEARFEEDVEISVGDPVSCMITRDLSEIYSFEGIALAREPKRLIIFNPPSILEYKEHRRRYPRYDVNLAGWIRVPLEIAPKEGQNSPRVEVVNLSLGGIAFRANYKLSPKSQVSFYAELYGREEGILESKLEVIHVSEEDGYVHGCKIVDITGKSLHELRKYLLQRQLEELTL